MPNENAPPTNATAPTNEKDTSSTGPGETTSSQTASSANVTPEPLKEFTYGFGEDVPSFLRGKTASEAAEVTGQLYKQVVASQSMVQPPLRLGGNSPLYVQQVPPQQPPQAPVAPAQNPFDAIAPEFQVRDAMLGGQARALAALQYPDDFRRWGNDIDLALAEIPPAQRTPQVVDWIVAGVRGRHINDLVNEYAKTKIDELVSSGQLRPQAAGEGTGEAAANRVDFEKLPPRYSAVLKNLGLTPGTIDGYLTKIYPELPLSKAREKWMKLASSGDIITDGEGKFHYDGDGNG